MNFQSLKSKTWCQTASQNASGTIFVCKPAFKEKDLFKIDTHVFVKLALHSPNLLFKLAGS